MKTKIFVIATLLVSIAMFSTGAFAYFSTTQTASAGHISAGTMGIQLATSPASGSVPSSSSYSDSVTPPWDLDLIVPDKVIPGCLWVKNTGDVDSVGVRWNFNNLVNSKSGVKLEDRMQITELRTSDSLWTWPAALLPGGAWYYGGAYDENGDGKITLGEMARWSDRFPPNTYDWVNDDLSVHFLTTIAPGNVGWICMTLKMINATPAEDNPYQGDSLTYDVVVTANNPEISQTTP